jgi:hypothetical protein
MQGFPQVYFFSFVWLFVVTRYLTYTFGPISITFIQPFLDDTSRTQERGPNFPTRPRGGRGMLELRNVFWKLRSKKVWKVFFTPHYRKNNFWNVFLKKRRPIHPRPIHPHAQPYKREGIYRGKSLHVAFNAYRRDFL